MTVEELQHLLKERCLPKQVVYVDGKELKPDMLMDGKRVEMVTDAESPRMVKMPQGFDESNTDYAARSKTAESDYHDRHPGKLDPREGKNYR